MKNIKYFGRFRSGLVPMVMSMVTLLFVSTAIAQVASTHVSKETQLKLLKLKEARVSLQAEEDMFEDYKKDLKDLQELYEQDVVTGKEVSEAETKVKDSARRLELAKIDLAKTALSFLQDATHISIFDAYQYIDSENNRHMSLTLENDSDLELALLGLGEGVPEAGIKREDVPGLLKIENLYVTVKVGATVIGDPFEIKVPIIPLGETVALDFKLNGQADEVTVLLKYHNKEDARNIYLAKKSTEDIVRVSSLQFAQEGQLGNWVDYGIDLERLAENEATFTLSVANLPDKYQYKFTDKGNQLSRVKFSQGVTKHSLVLKVSVPDTLSSKELRQAIPFFVIVGDAEAIETIEGYKKQGAITVEDLEALKVGYEKLELTPRGVGKFEISFNTLYYSVKVGDVIESTMTVKNTGSVKLANIRFTSELPYEWSIVYDPEEIESIEPRKEEEVTVQIVPPEDMEVGAYEVKIEASTEFEGTPVKSDQKNIRVEVEAKTNLSANVGLAVGLVVFLMIMVIVTIKISRR